MNSRWVGHNSLSSPGEKKKLFFPCTQIGKGPKASTVGGRAEGRSQIISAEAT